MPRLTSISAPIRGSRLRLLIVDDDEWRTTSAAVVKSLALEAGELPSLDRLSEQLDDAERSCVRERALRLLTYRDRTGRELAERLVADGYPEETVDSTVGELRRSGLVDDARFAESLARSLIARGYGRIRLRRELEAHGVDSGLTASVLAESLTEEDELGSARRIASALAARPAADPSKIAARLARKGFPSAVAIQATRLATGECLDAEDDR